jgi:hypothetical protein
MNVQNQGRVLVLATLLASLVTCGLLLAGSGSALEIKASSSVDRNIEPVVVPGSAVSAFSGLPTDQLFIYAFRAGTWGQIPAQVDEITASGAYTSTEDAVLDGNDEIVFMAGDLGDRAVPGVPITGSLMISPGWYELGVTDPLSPTHQGWAYLVHSSHLTATTGADYVSFDRVTHRINGTAYSLGFATPRLWADYLTLQDQTDILDRTKLRLLCTRRVIDPRTWLCPISEEETAELPDKLIKDGPIRIIARGGRLLAYGAMASWTTSLEIPSYLAGDIRFSMDFSPVVSGATFYNGVVPAGVTIDGAVDGVPATPFSRWWQVSTAFGTLIQVADTSAIGGTPSNYYQDDAAIDANDTGDHRRYGDAGVYVADPLLAFSYIFNIYALPASQPNVGAAYEGFFDNPLTVTATFLGGQRPVKVYLPLIVSGSG